MILDRCNAGADWQVSTAITVLTLSVILTQQHLRTEALYEEDRCTEGFLNGTCIIFRGCHSAVIEEKWGKYSMTCENRGLETVCCLDDVQSTVRNAIDFQEARKYSPNEYWMWNQQPRRLTTVWPSIDATKGVNNLGPGKKFETGRRAWEKCKKYQKLFYAGQRLICNVHNTFRVSDGVDADPAEFPHMALLGYGEQEIQFSCGGSLISDEYVLTAGHCTYKPQQGDVKWIQLGITSRSRIPSARKQLYRVAQIIKHPKYKSPGAYNDVALLRANKKIKLDRFVVPACLYTGFPVNDTALIVTGWGATKSLKESNVLQKAILVKFSEEECSNAYRGTRLMKRGFDQGTQLCYGDKTGSRDTCPGDSGGPIQLLHSAIYCMYLVMGITTRGRICGVRNVPALYNKVEPYIGWIEGIVWN